MITVTKEFSLSCDYPLHRIGNPENLLFFDIETTGFSGDYASVYLIGCIFPGKNRWTMIQWFADTAEAEREVLCAFFDFLKSYRQLVHFNGDTFDLPFLLKRCKALGLDCSFDGLESIDIYRNIKPYRKFLQLEHMKQKNIEQFLHISRKDTYTGGQLIEIYQDYLISKDPLLYDLLMLHNEDDLKGMPAILPILHYPDFIQSSFTFCGASFRQQPLLFDCTEKSVCLSYESPVFLPVPLEQTAGMYHISLQENRLTITAPLYEGELKYYFEDYQNYYYLIYEDLAIHKSVGQYVDRTARKKATARTCYCRHTGLFLPQPSAIWSPCLKKDYKTKEFYTPYLDELLCQTECLETYRKEVLGLCL